MTKQQCAKLSEPSVLNPAEGCSQFINNVLCLQRNSFNPLSNKSPSVQVNMARTTLLLLLMIWTNCSVIKSPKSAVFSRTDKQTFDLTVNALVWQALRCLQIYIQPLRIEQIHLHLTLYFWISGFLVEVFKSLMQDNTGWTSSTSSLQR